MNMGCQANGCCLNKACVSEGEGCGNGMVCSAGMCGACGGPGQRCCDQNSCANGGCCVADVCVAQQGSCGNGFTCTNGGCGNGMVSCGALNIQCCPLPNGGGFCTAASAYCLGGTCLHCGNTAEHCCEGESCSNGGCCAPVNNVYTCVAPNLLCPNGMTCGGPSCGNCGAIGQPCCQGAVCTQEDTVCSGGGANTCIACGGQGQRCCAPDNFCAEGRTCTNGTCQ
jgi:hypothetical protein